MDLVSSTLDRYLKHRFSGPTANANSKNNGTENRHPSQPQTSTGASIDSDDPTDPLLDTYRISFQLMTPCCVAVRNDCAFIAAGFENSHIYLWDLVKWSSDQSKVESLDTEVNLPDTLAYNQPQATLKLGQIHRLLAHSGPVYHIEFVPNNDLMLSSSEDTTIRLWSLKDKCNLTIYRGHSYPVWSIAVATHGDYFVSASMDATARLWRLDRMCPVRIFCGHDDDVECVIFHPNTKYVATGSSDTTVRLWSTSDGKMVRLMVGHAKPVTSLSFSPDGKFLASSSNDGTIKVWNLATNDLISDLLMPATDTIRGISNGTKAPSIETDATFSVKWLDLSGHPVAEKVSVSLWRTVQKLQSAPPGEKSIY